jgi:hypothetical protein
MPSVLEKPGEGFKKGTYNINELLTCIAENLFSVKRNIGKVKTVVIFWMGKLFFSRFKIKAS